MEDTLTILGGLFVIAAYGGFWLSVFRKAGYERGTSLIMALGMFIPLVNVGLAIYFATATWPIQSTLSTVRGQAGLPTESDPYEALTVATRLEARGNAAGAIAKYEEIMRRFAGTEAAQDAQASIRALKAKIGGT